MARGLNLCLNANNIDTDKRSQIKKCFSICFKLFFYSVLFLFIAKFRIPVLEKFQGSNNIKLHNLVPHCYMHRFHVPYLLLEVAPAGDLHKIGIILLTFIDTHLFTKTYHFFGLSRVIIVQPSGTWA